MSTIKLSRIIFEGPIQVAGMTVREYQILDTMPARYEAHLHGDIQCIALRDPHADVSILIPLRLVRSMEVCDKHNLPAASSSSEGMLAMQEQMREQLAFETPPETPPEAPSDYVEPRRRGRPRTKHLSSPDGNI